MSYFDKKKTKQKEPEEDAAIETLADVEAATLSELSAVEQSFRERMNTENSRFRDMCDTEYWFCVCFTSRKQKDEFMQKVGLDPNEKYISGKDMAKAFKKSIDTPDLKFAKIQPFNKDYLDRSEHF